MYSVPVREHPMPDLTIAERLAAPFEPSEIKFKPAW
jgi:hypothetical protein